MPRRVPKRRVGLLLFLFLIAGNAAARDEVKENEVPFRLLDGYLILVQGRIANLEDLNFLVDTGTNPSVIDRKVAHQLGLSGTLEPLTLLHGETSVERAIFPVIQVGVVGVSGISGLIQDLSPVERRLRIRVDAIIGLDVLGRRNFTIDYQAHKIFFSPIQTSSSYSLRSQQEIASVPALIGDSPARFLVDTGASDTVLFACDANRWQAARILRTRNSVNSESELFEGREVLLDRVTLGASKVGAYRVLLVNDPRLCQLSFQGVVGPTSLHLKQVTFDFDRQLVAWSR